MREISDTDDQQLVVSPTPAPVKAVEQIYYSRQLIERASRQTAFLFQCGLFVAVVALVVFAISELAARDSMLTMLNARGSALKSDFVERTRASAPSASASSSALDEERMVGLKQIEAVDELRRGIQSLAALGAESWDQSLRAIERRFAAISRLYQPASPQSGVATSAPPFSLSDLAQTWVVPILLYSSDQLLAMVVLGCGAIGAMISSLRSEQSLSLRSFVLGLASGFVAYLVIKGGKHVFLLQAQGELVAFNPYGSAFAGLLAGLFTEKAHQLLSFLVDDLASRVRAASANHSAQQGPVSPPPKGTDA